MIRSADTWWCRSPSRNPAVRPLTIAPSGTPLARWVCGSKKISARRTLHSLRPAEVGRRQLVEVLLAAQHLQVRVVQVEERLQVGERIPRPELVEIGSRKPDTVCGQPAPGSSPAPTSPRCARAARQSEESHPLASTHRTAKSHLARSPALDVQATTPGPPTDTVAFEDWRRFRPPAPTSPRKTHTHHTERHARTTIATAR